MLPPALMAAAVLGIVAAERQWRLREPTQTEPERTVRNVVLGAGALAVVQLVEAPLVQPLSRLVERRRLGLAQWLPAPAWVRDAAAFLLMDYGIYLWHVLTHKVPLLWRFHLVHHVDLDLDSTTALRFHAADMAISTPYRALQVLASGASPRALKLWQGFFFLSVLFHHSNARLPLRLERILSRVLTTPRMHGIHHSAVQAETDSNWSSGLSLWDHLHRTFRLDVPQDEIVVGVPAYRDPSELGIAASLALPFGPVRDAWVTKPAAMAKETSRFHHVSPMGGQAKPVSRAKFASSKRGSRRK
ncbi:MAG: sterol desaturase family protein [Acetobacteraceae bacterium]|nr:sterol desaturase family protein [Acetobacteraceae bacterium]